MLSLWMFAREPKAEPNIHTVPVIMPEDVASKVKLSDLKKGREQRVYGDHLVGEVELRGWRFVAKSIFRDAPRKGLFPWEIECAAESQNV